MTYYITKYAATKGILTEEFDGERDGLVGAPSGRLYRVGKEAFTSLDEARLDAIKRTRKKITALFKKESKLEALIVNWESELPL